MPIERILILEDNEPFAKEVTNFLRQKRYDVAAAGRLSAAREWLARDTFDLMLLDLSLPDGSGMDLLKELQAQPQRPVVVVMTGTVSVKTVVECMHNGAFDYLAKPFALDELELTIQKADRLSSILRVNRFLNHQQGGESQQALLGKSAGMEQLRQLIRKVARTDATVLIQGESGTGKELVACEIFRQSARAEGPFIRVNCAAIPENLIESEFFGHEKGAFTGAVNKREGRFELAHGGTILLDEVSEIPAPLQAKLLRVIQERELERVGGSRTIKVDVRVIATTNRNLTESVARKEFREDLFYRLNVVPIHAPPLRKRREDVAYLAGQFLQRYARQHGVRVNGLSEECLRALHDHDWPGNVRELQNVIERGVILCSDGEVLQPHQLGLLQPGTAAAVAPPSRAADETYASEPKCEFPSLDELERQHIYAALKHCEDNRTHAARLLGISIRTLRNKLSEYGGKRAAVAAEPALAPARSVTPS